jgi:hypothetical protein
LTHHGHSITWHKLRSGLYEATLDRPDLGTSITVTVERADEDNSVGETGWWRFEHSADFGHWFDTDSTGWDYPTMRDAKGHAERFATTCRKDERFGLVAA